MLQVDTPRCSRKKLFHSLVQADSYTSWDFLKFPNGYDNTHHVPEKKYHKNHSTIQIRDTEPPPCLSENEFVEVADPILRTKKKIPLVRNSPAQRKNKSQSFARISDMCARQLEIENVAHQKTKDHEPYHRAIWESDSKPLSNTTTAFARCSMKDEESALRFLENAYNHRRHPWAKRQYLPEENRVGFYSNPSSFKTTPKRPASSLGAYSRRSPSVASSRPPSSCRSGAITTRSGAVSVASHISTSTGVTIPASYSDTLSTVSKATREYRSLSRISALRAVRSNTPTSMALGISTPGRNSNCNSGISTARSLSRSSSTPSINTSRTSTGRSLTWLPSVRSVSFNVSDDNITDGSFIFYDDVSSTNRSMNNNNINNNNNDNDTHKVRCANGDLDDPEYQMKGLDKFDKQLQLQQLRREREQEQERQQQQQQQQRDALSTTETDRG